jgi:hypothetical protein
VNNDDITKRATVRHKTVFSVLSSCYILLKFNVVVSILESQESQIFSDLIVSMQ